MSRRFKQVDVFTDKPLLGNPVAVVLDAEGLSTGAMQRFANWTNLSETTFVLPPTAPGADYRLRIFTPTAELPFAGHPTIGSAHAVIEAGMVDRDKARLVQECAAGLLAIDVEHAANAAPRLFVTAPPTQVRPVPTACLAELDRILKSGWKSSTAPLLIDVGPIWLVAMLADAASVLELRPDLAALAELSRTLSITGLTVFGAASSGADAIAVRSFAPAHGISEDPVCGSGNICVARYLANTGALPGVLPRYAASQGTALGRDGHVFVRVEGDTVQVGGHAVTCVDGTVVIA